MKRGAVIGIAVGAAAVIAAGVGVAVWLMPRAVTPEDVAMAYFSALESGDADAALELAAIPKDSADQASTAYDGVVEAATDAEVRSSTQEPGAARVVVTFTLADGENEATLEMTSDDDDGWKITNALSELTVDTTIGDSVGIGALAIPAPGSVALLPGQYDVQAMPRGLVAGSATVEVTIGAAARASIEASVAPDATAAAQAQLDIYAEACTQPAASVPRNCGLRVPWAADLATLTSIAFRIDQSPAIVLSGDGRTFAATDGIVVATATGTTREGATASFTYRADDWALRGTVTFTGNEMLLAVG